MVLVPTVDTHPPCHHGNRRPVGRPHTATELQPRYVLSRLASVTACSSCSAEAATYTRQIADYGLSTTLFAEEARLGRSLGITEVLDFIEFCRRTTGHLYENTTLEPWVVAHNSPANQREIGGECSRACNVVPRRPCGT